MSESQRIISRGQRNWLKAALQPAMLLYVVMIPALWIAVTAVLMLEHERTLEGAIQQGGNLARLFEQDTTAMLESVDRTLLLLRQEYERDPDHFDLNRLLKRATFSDDLTIHFAIAGQGGDAKTLLSPDNTVVTADFADRDWFKKQRDAKIDELVISRPVAGRISKKWSIILSRRLTDRDGNFAGVIAASVDPEYLGSFYKTIDVGEHGSVILRDRNGVILASGGTVGNAMGRQVMQPALREALANSPVGYYWGGGAVDGVNRLVSYRTSERLPVLTMVGLAEDDIFKPYERTQLIFISAAGILTILLIIAFFASLRHRLRLAERENLIARQKLHLDSALANMPQGLCMFDRDQRLIVCNEQYVDLYDMSEEQTRPGTHLRSILEHQLAIGNLSVDSDYIAKRLNAAVAHKAYQITNRLRDGRLISVTHRPMDGGGWVSTHTDVTEQVRREESFRLLFESSPVPMWVSDRESLRFLAVNDAAIARYGYSREQFMLMTVPMLRPEQDRERFGEFLRKLEVDQFSKNLGQHLTSDGQVIDVSVYSRALGYDGRNARLTVVHDITKSKQVEDELRRTQKFLDAIIESVPAPILVKDVTNANGDAASCAYTLINRAFEELFGVSRTEIVGKTVAELYPKERAEFIAAENNQALRSQNPIVLSDHDVYTATNGIRICTATTVAVRDDSQAPQYLVTVLQDVTERNRAEQRIVRMAHYDHLTNLANRKTFNDSMEKAIGEASGCGDQFTFLSLDLDGFKETNDTHGHLIGDALLCEVSRRLVAAADGAFIARIGGDEFALIVDGGMQIATLLADRLLGVFKEDIGIEGRKIKTGATIGAAIYPNHGSDTKTLISNADIALYRAKAAARGSVMFFDQEMGEEVRERRALHDVLRSAVECQQLHLHYQPQMTMSGEMVGFEALARWQDRQHGLVSPDLFIPIAEESGLIIPLGEWVLREACREAATWRNPLTVAVNVSPVQFRYGDLPMLVHSILLETGLAPARLELEITESVFIDDFPRAISILSRLKTLGVRIALDDFGSGYSSLSYLHSFAFDKIKIDRTFVLDLERNQHSMAIVRAVIDLGHSLGIPVLAEGVETAAQRAMLLDRRCDELQGYLLGHPMPIEHYAELTGAEVPAWARTLMAS